MKSVTIAQIKLAKAVAETSAAAVAKKAGLLANTVRLLAAGAVEPKLGTVERLQAIDITPLDWFTPASPDSDDDLSGKPTAVKATSTSEPVTPASVGLSDAVESF